MNRLDCAEWVELKTLIKGVKLKKNIDIFMNTL